MTTKYLVVTKGLGNIIDCKTRQGASSAIRKLKRMGYKKPLMYLRLSGGSQ